MPLMAYRPRVRAALRRVNPSPAITLALALVIGGAGGATAATGGNFILGHANKESSTASLSNSSGTALKLSAPSGTAPLAVNRKTMVRKLNAQYVGGFTASQLGAQGSSGGTVQNIDVTLSGDLVASTTQLSAGVYYATATAELIVLPGDAYGFCGLERSSDPGLILVSGGEDREGSVQAAETDAISVNAGDTLQEWCFTGGSSGSFTLNSGITAIRVMSSSGGTPARAGSPVRKVLRDLVRAEAGARQSSRRS